MLWDDGLPRVRGPVGYYVSCTCAFSYVAGTVALPGIKRGGGNKIGKD